MTAAGTAAARLSVRLARIGAENDRTRIFTALDADGAAEAARAADERAESDARLGPLDGALVAVKANIAVAGLPWTAGTAGWRDRIAERDSHVVARLRAAGAVVIGALNMEEGALGAVTDNPTYGRCLNPLGDNLTPGGSSGGSGAAAASGLVDIALGTDTMGSVRIPAAYCGVAGLKPTRGLIGRSGLACLSPSLDAIGPLAARAGLLAPALRALAGADAEDPESRAAPPMDETGLAGARLGVPEGLGGVEIEPAIRAGFERALGAARDRGAEIVGIEMPGWRPAEARRAGLLLSEAEGAAEMAELMARSGALSDGFRDALDFGARASSAKIVAALARLRAAAAAAHRALEKVDALILPTAPQRAFAHGTPAPANQADLTALANIAGLPAVAFPVPLKGEARPASAQLVGPAFADLRLIGWAAALEDALAL